MSRTAQIMPERASGRRGKANATPSPPVTPPSPSLQSNPVPLVRDRVTYSVGPASAPVQRLAFRSARQLMTIAGHQPGPVTDEALELVRELDRGQNVIDVDDLRRRGEDENALADRICDYSWGWFIVVTDYSPQAKADLPDLLDKLVLITKLALQKYRSNTDLFAEEAFARFRLEVVEDEASQANASIDRVRAEFLAMIRARRPEWNYIERTAPPDPIKNRGCLLFDAETMQNLRDLEVSEDTDTRDIYRSEFDCLKVVDGTWRWRERSYSPYRGHLTISTLDLMDLYRYASHGPNGIYEAFEDSATCFSKEPWTY